jgi:hypothetical protein
VVCGCVYVASATIAIAKGGEMEDHKIGFVNFGSQVSGTWSITSASINLIGYSLDRIVDDTITEGGYGLRPYLAAPTNEQRPADARYLSGGASPLRPSGQAGHRQLQMGKADEDNGRRDST